MPKKNEDALARFVGKCVAGASLSAEELRMQKIRRLRMREMERRNEEIERMVEAVVRRLVAAGGFGDSPLEPVARCVYFENAVREGKTGAAQILTMLQGIDAQRAKSQREVEALRADFCL
jgi:hypothetical protein